MKTLQYKIRFPVYLTKTIKGVLFPRHLANDWCNVHQFVSFDIRVMHFYAIKALFCKLSKWTCADKIFMAYQKLSYRSCNKNTRNLHLHLKQVLKSMSCLAIR